MAAIIGTNMVTMRKLKMRLLEYRGDEHDEQRIERLDVRSGRLETATMFLCSRGRSPRPETEGCRCVEPYLLPHEYPTTTAGTGLKNRTYTGESVPGTIFLKLCLPQLTTSAGRPRVCLVALEGSEENPSHSSDTY